MYEYRGRVKEVIDNNTLIINVDLGFKIYADMWLNIDHLNISEQLIPTLKEHLLGKVVYFVAHKVPRVNADIYWADIAFDKERELFLLEDEVVKWYEKTL